MAGLPPRGARGRGRQRSGGSRPGFDSGAYLKANGHAIKSRETPDHLVWPLNLRPLTVLYGPVKRALDVGLGGIALLLASPILLVAGARIYAHDRGPLLYRGPRVGRDGQPFEMLKFRTMIVDADKVGASSTTANDPRITPVGGFLRRYKLDELPQLFNVIRGDMSLVGPRPQVQWAVDEYSEEERAILSVRPGLTDYASIVFSNEGEILRGSLDPDRTYMEVIHPRKMQLGLRYVREQSLATDLKILLLTLSALAGRPPDTI